MSRDQQWNLIKLKIVFRSLGKDKMYSLHQKPLAASFSPLAAAEPLPYLTPPSLNVRIKRRHHLSSPYQHDATGKHILSDIHLSCRGHMKR